jgi:acyl-coenzyme A synthetase/AMP-(fatty) acid ligase
MTFADLDAASRQVVSLLDRHGVAPGTCVCLRAPNGPGFLALLLGLLRHPAVPILLDSQTPAPEVERVMRALDSGGLMACATGWPTNPHDFVFQAAVSDRPVRVTKPAVIKLTSGSTGEARGIEVPLEALLADEENLARTMGIVESDRLLAAVPLAHSYGLSSLALHALVRGTTLLVPEARNPFAPLQMAAELSATVFPTTPSYLDGLVRWEGDLEPVDSLRVLISAGAPLSPKTARRIRAAWGRPVHAFYGASESGGIAYDREGGAAEEGLIGEPVENVKIDLQEVAGHPGSGRRVLVRSAAVARGYLPGQDESLKDGRFTTEDLGSLEDGRLRLHGRLGSAVKIRGRKIQPAEVEQVLTTMPGVQEAHVHAVPGTEEGQQTLEALVVPISDDISRRAVIAWCRRYLAPEKVPRSIVLMASLPRNERGKIDTRKIKRPRD